MFDHGLTDLNQFNDLQLQRLLNFDQGREFRCDGARRIDKKGGELQYFVRLGMQSGRFNVDNCKGLAHGFPRAGKPSRCVKSGTVVGKRRFTTGEQDDQRRLGIINASGTHLRCSDMCCRCVKTHDMDLGPGHQSDEINVIN